MSNPTNGSSNISNKRCISKFYFGTKDSNPFVYHNKDTEKKKSINKKRKHKNDESDNEDEDEESDDPFTINKIFYENKIFLKENHLYFHTNVNQKSCEQVKQLMRTYSSKFNRLQKTHTCVKFECKPLYIHIYSPGGDVYAGLALYDFIIQYREHIPIYTIVEGIAASAATFISVAGTKRFITPSSYMLIHQLSTFMYGNFEQLKDEFDNSKKLMDKIMNIYSEHTTITKKRIPKILKHDLIWDAEECVQNGLVDKIKLVDLFNDEDKDDDQEENNEE
jgi:ATP-dependent Clp endopeptidase proteolytic subunit ClpP